MVKIRNINRLTVKSYLFCSFCMFLYKSKAFNVKDLPVIIPIFVTAY